VRLEDGSARLPALGELPARLAVVRRQYLGTLGRQPAVSLELADGVEAPGGLAFEGLRGLFALLDEASFRLAVLAIQIVDWDRDHQFCGRCGERSEDRAGERSKLCPRCGLAAYPRLSPAVIVLVERGDEVLLARSPHFLPGVYSTLAGFVDPGETLEQAVEREIGEEVGVEVENVRYFGSQPWPFPNSLMIGFRADYAGGEIVIAEEEIEDAGWFRAGELPRIPSRISIARALIETFLDERRSASSSGSSRRRSTSRARG
jgi:NAD+ diphosphatase